MLGVLSQSFLQPFLCFLGCVWATVGATLPATSALGQSTLTCMAIPLVMPFFAKICRSISVRLC